MQVHIYKCQVHTLIDAVSHSWVAQIHSSSKRRTKWGMGYCALVQSGCGAGVGEGWLRVRICALAPLLSMTVKDTKGWVVNHFKSSRVVVGSTHASVISDTLRSKKKHKRELLTSH